MALSQNGLSQNGSEQPHRKLRSRFAAEQTRNESSPAREGERWRLAGGFSRRDAGSGVCSKNGSPDARRTAGKETSGDTRSGKVEDNSTKTKRFNAQLRQAIDLIRQHFITSMIRALFCAPHPIHRWFTSSWQRKQQKLRSQIKIKIKMGDERRWRSVLVRSACYWDGGCATLVLWWCPVRCVRAFSPQHEKVCCPVQQSIPSACLTKRSQKMSATVTQQTI